MLIKRVIACLILLMRPTISGARLLYPGNDHCTNPAEYTVDRRCYVTDAQLATKPYNAVVGITNGGICTGTIVNENNELYIYTAKHCVHTQNYTNVVDNIEFWIPSIDRNSNAAKMEFGDWDGMNSDVSGDWAKYKITGADDGIPFTYMSDGQGFIIDDARVIGNGSLRIMSDAEIEDFKSKYKYYLDGGYDDTIKEIVGQEWPGASDSFFEQTGGVRVAGTDMYGQIFLALLGLTDTDYYTYLFEDRNLKVSHCKYSRSGSKRGCQTWDGSSGGGIFDASGDLMGISTRGAAIIGGEFHAYSTGSDKGVNLQPGLINNVFKDYIK